MGRTYSYAMNNDILLYNYSDPAVKALFASDHALISSSTAPQGLPLSVSSYDFYSKEGQEIYKNLTTNDITVISNEWRFNILGGQSNAASVCLSNSLAVRRVRIADWEMVPSQNEDAMIKVKQFMLVHVVFCFCMLNYCFIVSRLEPAFYRLSPA